MHAALASYLGNACLLPALVLHEQSGEEMDMLLYNGVGRKCRLKEVGGRRCRSADYRKVAVTIRATRHTINGMNALYRWDLR